MGVSISTDKPPSMIELQILVIEADVSCMCDAYLGEDIQRRDDESGITLAGHGDVKQWVFFPCPKCGHDWSLNKILNKIERMYLEANL